jgi:hypothetical protein
MPDQSKDREIRQGLPRRSRHLLHASNAPLRIDKRPLLLAPSRSRQKEIRAPSRFRVREHVLNDQELEQMQLLLQKTVTEE